MQVVHTTNTQPHDIELSGYTATPAQVIQPDVSLTDLHPGMACRTPQGHTVRITSILRAESQAEVHLLKNPRLSGPMNFNELTPIPVKVLKEDSVFLHIGDLGFPIQARVVEVSGEFALFFSTKWNEALWGHTAHVYSISPRGIRR